MKRLLPLLMIVLTVALVAFGSVEFTRPSASTPERAVQAMFTYIKARDWDRAFALVANAPQIDRADFIAELQGRDASLRTYSALEKVETSTLHQNDAQALVRTALTYFSAVGRLEDTRDLGLVHEGDKWKVIWPVQKQPKVPPQVIPVTYLRWDVISRGAADDWGAQDAAPPRIRITSMNAIEHQGGTVILGEIVNDDTVPGFISVDATILGANNEVLGEETAFDKITHTLLPRQVSPFRIDFPRVPLAQVKNVRMTPHSLLVAASADYRHSYPHSWRSLRRHGRRTGAGRSQARLPRSPGRCPPRAPFRPRCRRKRPYPSPSRSPRPSPPASTATASRSTSTCSTAAWRTSKCTPCSRKTPLGSCRSPRSGRQTLAPGASLGEAASNPPKPA